MTSAPCAGASRAASSCLSIIDSWSPDQSVCSNAALTVLDIAPSWGSCRALRAPVPPMLTTLGPERERSLTPIPPPASGPGEPRCLLRQVHHVREDVRLPERLARGVPSIGPDGIQQRTAQRHPVVVADEATAVEKRSRRVPRHVGAGA